MCRAFQIHTKFGWQLLHLLNGKSTMDSSSKKSADDAKSMNDLFELVEKLTIQLNEKDKELGIEKQEKQVCTCRFVN
jgi:hypothetical protein